jgi:hypothetical protein
MERTEKRTSRKTEGKVALTVEVRKLGDNVMFRRQGN